jgi:hypothetical protein
LRNRLDAAVRAAGTGSVDGGGFGNGEAVLHAHGPDADRLFASMTKELQDFGVRPIHAVLVSGDDVDDPQTDRHIDLPAQRPTVPPAMS